jgi:hypothetical protein
MSDDPSGWMESTQIIDLHDPKLRLKAHSLTQLARSDREKVLAIYSSVKRILFAKPVKLRLRTAHEVLRGLTRAIASAGRPVVQVWLDDKWPGMNRAVTNLRESDGGKPTASFGTA